MGLRAHVSDRVHYNRKNMENNKQLASSLFVQTLYISAHLNDDFILNICFILLQKSVLLSKI